MLLILLTAGTIFTIVSEINQQILDTIQTNQFFYCLFWTI